ncbi:hypothetical protein KAR91_45455 [Candidatus Pacearchaeota archaeon]|nr:hypothetical protein [Candidatus Pacearchaeota archaeon]
MTKGDVSFVGVVEEALKEVEGGSPLKDYLDPCDIIEALKLLVDVTKELAGEGGK